MRRTVYKLVDDDGFDFMGLKVPKQGLMEFEDFRFNQDIMSGIIAYRNKEDAVGKAGEWGCSNVVEISVDESEMVSLDDFPDLVKFKEGWIATK